MIPSRDEPSTWGETLAGIIRGSRFFDRVEVLREAGSTQDEAHRLASGRPGLVVLAERQGAGRGRLGRVWDQRGELGLAMTAVLDATPVETLSLAVGLAVARALDELVYPTWGLRWPNDVVEPVSGGGRKIAGVLIEVRDRLPIVGIGVNVYQKAQDFPAPLQRSAVSASQLGSRATRLELAAGVLRALETTLAMDAPALARQWVQRDVLTGTRQAFIHAATRVEGVVESIDPTHEIVVRTAEGMVVRLPALTTSLLHG
jgi:BirA family biotin operon repressor/biotin-[acetyl-CoA-carboxylase] ligase